MSYNWGADHWRWEHTFDLQASGLRGFATPLIQVYSWKTTNHPEFWLFTGGTFDWWYLWSNDLCSLPRWPNRINATKKAGVRAMSILKIMFSTCYTAFAAELSAARHTALSYHNLPITLHDFAYSFMATYEWDDSWASRKTLSRGASVQLEAWIYQRVGFEGAKPWAPPSCFRGFSVNYNAFEGPMSNKMAAQYLLFNISRPLSYLLTYQNF